MSDIQAEVEATLWPIQVGGMLAYECQSCGALVHGRYTHAEWHREIDERA